MSPVSDQLRAVRVPEGPSVTELLPALRAALSGDGPALAPVGHREQAPEGHLPADAALIVGTSGSTGIPKRAVLSAAAVLASARATHERLGGPGQWVLTMPARHIAGVQVLVRSMLAADAGVDRSLRVLDNRAGFDVVAFAQLTGQLDAGRAYTAMVPTQLARLLAAPVGRLALRRYDAILVGGAATAPNLLARAADAGARVLTTYGMSETAGGCVYAGEPLCCTAFRLQHDRVLLGGDTLASGYLGDPEASERAFVQYEGTRWFVTDDVGHLDQAGRLRVDGRADDVVNTGGLKVAPRLVEDAALAHLPGVAEAVVVGLPDAEWGQVVVLAVVMRPGSDAPRLAWVREQLRDALPAHALPRRVAELRAIPVRGPGKPDRMAVQAMLRGSQAGVRDCTG